MTGREKRAKEIAIAEKDSKVRALWMSLKDIETKELETYLDNDLLIAIEKHPVVRGILKGVVSPT